MPAGVLGLSDPDVHLIDDRWVMFIGGFSTSFRNRLYRATLRGGVPLDQPEWTLERQALVGDPPKDAWDGGGMHTPKYVAPHQNNPARLYYAGRASKQHSGTGSAYAIGCLTQDATGRWLRSESPVLRGWPSRPSVLEPRVLALDGGYRMWFLATPHEVGPGEQPLFELHVTDSADGVHWDAPRMFATTEEGWFDCAVYRTRERWEMLVARGTNLHGTSPYPAQGLWVMRADHPAADRSTWSSPQRVLDTDVPGTPAWIARGVCGPSVVIGPEGQRIVFLTGTHAARFWWQAVKIRLSAARRLPVPAPYYLATGVLVVSDNLTAQYHAPP